MLFSKIDNCTVGTYGDFASYSFRVASTALREGGILFVKNEESERVRLFSPTCWTQQ